MHCGEGQGCVCLRDWWGQGWVCVGKGVNGLCVLGERVTELSVFWGNPVGGAGEGVSQLVCWRGLDLGRRGCQGEWPVDYAVFGEGKASNSYHLG